MTAENPKRGGILRSGTSSKHSSLCKQQDRSLSPSNRLPQKYLSAPEENFPQKTQIFISFSGLGPGASGVLPARLDRGLCPLLVVLAGVCVSASLSPLRSLFFWVSDWFLCGTVEAVGVVVCRGSCSYFASRFLCTLVLRSGCRDFGRSLLVGLGRVAPVGSAIGSGLPPVRVGVRWPVTALRVSASSFGRFGAVSASVFCIW